MDPLYRVLNNLPPCYYRQERIDYELVSIDGISPQRKQFPAHTLLPHPQVPLKTKSGNESKWTWMFLLQLCRLVMIEYAIISIKTAPKAVEDEKFLVSIHALWLYALCDKYYVYEFIV